MKKLAFGMGAAALLFGACAEGPSNTTDDFGYNGTGIEFKVSPLTLDTLGDACYSFAVINGANELVVARGPSTTALAGNLTGVTGTLPTGTAANAICASQFGNTTGGDISYVAPCDADQPAHSVRLWVNKLCASGETGQSCNEIQSYVNPCPSTGCVLSPVTCVENADTPVTFNFTIMGQADQGFFDIAVNFDDIFCSAKLDSCYNEEQIGTDGFTPQMIRMLFDMRETLDTTCPHLSGCDVNGNAASASLPLGGGLVVAGATCANGQICASPVCVSTTTECSAFTSSGAFSYGQTIPGGPNPNYQNRMNTVVLALACTAGPIGAEDDNVSELWTTKLSVRCTEGAWSIDVSDATVTQEGNQVTSGAPAQNAGFPWAAYFGNESLPGVDKVYLNVALGLEGLSNCVVSWEGTVYDSTNPPVFGSQNVYTNYPTIVFATKPPITNDAGVTQCQENPLNGSGSTVYTKAMQSTTNSSVRDVYTGQAAGLTNQVAQVTIKEGNLIRYVLPAVQMVETNVVPGGVILEEAAVNTTTLTVLDPAVIYSKEQFRTVDQISGLLTADSAKVLPEQVLPIVSQDFQYLTAIREFSKRLENRLDYTKAAKID